MRLERRSPLTPGAPLTRAWLRAVAFAALARPTAAPALLDTALTLPVETANDRPRTLHRGAPRVHGDARVGRLVGKLRTGGAWRHDRLPPGGRWSGTGAGRPTSETFEERLGAAWSLDLAGARADAEEIARGLLPDDSNYVDVVGELATLAAEGADTVRADSLDRWLALQPVARVGWPALVYRARVAVLRGRPDSAVARTREALEAGAWPGWIHLDSAFVPQRKRRDFVSLTAPRG